METSDALGALALEFNNLAKALQDREHALGQHTDQISELRDFFGDIIRSVQVGILVLDDANQVQLVNPAAQSLFALPPVNLAGQPLVMTGSQEGLAKLLEDAAHVRSSSETRKHRANHAEERLLDVAMMPIRDESGFSSRHVLVLAEDVTQQENTKQRLVESERLAAIGRIAAQITHEIRNPLSAIGLNIELLEDDLPALPEDRQREAKAVLASVAGEIDRLTAITEGYLRVANRPPAKKILATSGIFWPICAPFRRRRPPKTRCDSNSAWGKTRKKSSPRGPIAPGLAQSAAKCPLGGGPRRHRKALQQQRSKEGFASPLTTLDQVSHRKI